MASLTCSEHLGLSVGGETSLLLQMPLSPRVSHHSAVLVWLHGGSWLSKRIGSLWQPQSCTVSRLPYSFDQSKSQGQPKFKWKMDSTPRLEEHDDCPGNVDGHLFAEKLLQWLTASKLLQIPSLSKLTLDNCLQKKLIYFIDCKMPPILRCTLFYLLFKKKKAIKQTITWHKLWCISISVTLKGGENVRVRVNEKW